MLKAEGRTKILLLCELLLME